jgi:hypothetical protein
MSTTSTELAIAPAHATAQAVSGRRRLSLLAQVGLLASRAAFGGFLFLTSVYCLLLYIPFTYFGFIHHPLLWWLPPFVKFHAYIYAVLFAAVAATLAPAIRDQRTRRAAIGFLVVNGAAAVYLLFRPALGAMLRDLFAFVWSLLCLFPVLWLTAIDLAGSDSKNRRQYTPAFAAIVFSAAAVAIAFALMSAVGRMAEHVSLAPLVLLRGISASVLLHTVIFLAVGSMLLAINLFSRRTPWRAQAASTLKFVLAWMICEEVIRSLVLPTVSFDGLQAAMYAAGFAFVLVTWALAIAKSMQQFRLAKSIIREHRLVAVGVAAVSVLAIAYAVPAALRSTDWDFVMQKLATILLWFAVFTCVSRIWNWQKSLRQADGGNRRSNIAAVGFLLVVIVSFGVHELHAHYDPALRSEWNAALEDYAGTDISFKTAFDILSRSVDNNAYAGFYSFLRRNTNLAPETPSAPADTRLVADLKPSPGPKPNIFFFVIDSLRQDYLLPYNPTATFTPEIGEFARDSIVMRNAFSRYAGTALSEPAIWVGALQLHKQYIEPFAPMNNLQKLLDVDGYHSYISVDPILGAILHPSTSITELDKDTKLWNDLDFVTTLKELEAKIDQRSDHWQPIFAYTQPQNVHTLTLERSHHGGTRRDISIYECRRMDAAFGEFIRFLQARGLYDNSIIVITSDHGDSYGEFGRYGHADFLFPEVIRIPLIMHVPAKMREGLVWDPDQLAFSTDITPTLYYLLGHRPIMNNELFGRPLLTQTMAEQQPYLRSNYLIASSYAPVYGVLSKRGQSLFIVDGVNQRNYFYDLASDPRGIHNRITPAIRDAGEPIIRREIGLIDSFYHFTPSQQ